MSAEQAFDHKACKRRIVELRQAKQTRTVRKELRQLLDQLHRWAVGGHPARDMRRVRS